MGKWKKGKCAFCFMVRKVRPVVDGTDPKQAMVNACRDCIPVPRTGG